MIVDLSTHPRRYVTIPDLTEYLQLPRETVYWHIRVGHLEAIHFSPRILRIETTEARRWAELYAFPRSKRPPKPHKVTSSLATVNP